MRASLRERVSFATRQMEIKARSNGSKLILSPESPIPLFGGTFIPVSRGRMDANTIYEDAERAYPSADSYQARRRIMGDMVQRLSTGVVSIIEAQTTSNQKISRRDEQGRWIQIEREREGILGVSEPERLVEEATPAKPRDKRLDQPTTIEASVVDIISRAIQQLMHTEANRQIDGVFIRQKALIGRRLVGKKVDQWEITVLGHQGHGAYEAYFVPGEGFRTVTTPDTHDNPWRVLIRAEG